MSMVTVTTEQPRGCGYRKPDKSGVGIYLVGPAEVLPCGALPIALTVCPCCSGGIKPSRGWTWIQPSQLFRGTGSCRVEAAVCATCPFGSGAPEGRHGLLWVGEKFYATPSAFMHEARRMGISRKLAAVPTGFEVGKTIVYLAHRRAVMKEIQWIDPGVFASFRPTHVDLVIADENDVPEKAKRLADKIGDKARIIKVTRAPHPQAELGFEAET